MQLRYFRDGLIFLIGAIGAIKVGSMVVSATSSELVLICATVIALAWMLWAGDYWWTLVPAGATVGGILYFGFKVYPIEITMFLALVGLLLPIFFSGKALLMTNRKPLPLSFYLLSLYAFLRIGWDMYVARSGWETMSRTLFNIEWPFLFGFLFYHYGKTSLVPAAIGIITTCISVRIVGVIFAYFSTSIFYIPGINYIISFSGEDDLFDLRTCSYYLLVVLLLHSQAARHVLLRGVWLFLACVAAYLTFLGGSRSAALMTLLLPIPFFIASRRWLLLFSAALVAIGLCTAVNLYPSVLRQFPGNIERAFSGIVFTPNDLESDVRTGGSTQWHIDLQREGFNRWTASMPSMLFGDNFKPYREDAYYALGQNQEEDIRVSASADVMAYESGLWSVLASLGSTGFVLYALLFIQLWRYTLQYLWHNEIHNLSDGMIFWATYTSISWFAFSYFAGEFPSLGLALMIISVALVQDKNTSVKEEVKPDSLVMLEAQDALDESLFTR